MMRTSPRTTIRRGPGRRVRDVLCAVAFVATAGLIYYLGAGPPDRAREEGATATVRLQFLSQAPVDSRWFSSSEIQRRIMAEENIGRALVAAATGRVPPPAGGLRASRIAVDDARRRLSVSVGPLAEPNRWRITLSCRGSDTAGAARLVNAVARQFAEDQRAYWDATARQPYLAARDAMERARNEVFRAKARLEQLLDEQFSNDGGSIATKGATAAASASPDTSAAAVSPEWADLRRQKEELLRRREALLVDRMPGHPAVLDVETQLAQVDQLLAQTPRQVRQAGSTVRSQGANEFRTRKADLEAAGSNYDRLADDERLAWQRQLAIPGIELELAKTDPSLVSTRTSPSLLLAALSAALCMAVGLGMIAGGVRLDGALSSVAEVQEVIQTPIVGVISAAPVSGKRSHLTAMRHPGGAALIFYGGILIGACLAVAIVFLWR